MLGDVDVPSRGAPPLPSAHIRLSSTEQYCTAKRRRRRRRRLDEPTNAAATPRGGRPLPAGTFGPALARDPTGADFNKTTMAAADPTAAIDFAVRVDVEEAGGGAPTSRPTTAKSPPLFHGRHAPLALSAPARP